MVYVYEFVKDALLYRGSGSRVEGRMSLYCRR